MKKFVLSMVAAFVALCMVSCGDSAKQNLLLGDWNASESHVVYQVAAALGGITIEPQQLPFHMDTTISMTEMEMQVCFTPDNVLLSNGDTIGTYVYKADAKTLTLNCQGLANMLNLPKELIDLLDLSHVNLSVEQLTEQNLRMTYLIDAQSDIKIDESMKGILGAVLPDTMLPFLSGIGNINLKIKGNYTISMVKPSGSTVK